jgi:uncharacterized protein (DUF362 family)/Pyruvate/2-oxoacid:ferredoxin oxidoreductase delta subunit
MDRVAVVECHDYNSQNVDTAIEECIKRLGGIEKFIKPGMKVLIKCNLLMRKKPEECTTTHPAVVEAVVKKVQKAGAIPIIGDSPGGLYNRPVLKMVYDASGISKVAEKTGAELNYNTDTVEVAHPEGKIIKRLTVIKILEEVNAVISLAKLKTHSMTLFTGAVKNLFGVIPGTTKAEYHLRMKELRDFSDMLVDICTYVKPVLSIMDGVEGMEGNGPSAGIPRKIGAILASTSPYALDLAATSLVGIPPEKVCTIQRAVERGLCSNRLEDIQIIGQEFEQLRISDFKLPDGGEVNFFARFFGSNSRIADFLNYYLGPRPNFDHDICIGCRDCQRSCPPKAITMVEGKPLVDLKKCIRCFCCQELCPKKAVKVKRSWFFKAFR